MALGAMLVCNVSLLPRRTVSVGIAETASALDSPGTGNVIFATLVDDPASVRDTVDAYSGEIMLEAASAQATVNAGLTYAANVVEAVTAMDAPDATSGVALVARSAMLPFVMVNSDGTPRDANADGVMVNL